MIRLGLPLVVGLVLITSCSRLHLDVRLSELEREEQRRQAKLDELAGQISAAEQRAAHAKADATYQECRAKRTELIAMISVAKADCVRVVAERGACLAQNESRTTKGAGAGCAAGWLAALLTGGAAAPAIAAGCLGGAALSHATRSECGEVPRCAISSEEVVTRVLRSSGHSSLPSCKKVKPVSLPEAPVLPQLTNQSSKKNACSIWQIAWIDFAAPRRKRGGEAWDIDGSGPDLVYMVEVDGRQIYKSPKSENYAWNHEPHSAIHVSPGQALVIELVDRDALSYERIASFRGEIPQTLPAEQLILQSGRATAGVQLECSGP